METPKTELLQKMLEGVQNEIDYMNDTTAPALVSRFGANTFKTGLVIRCTEEPLLIDLKEKPVKVIYSDCIRFNGQKMCIDKEKFLARYYATEEGKKYREFLDRLPTIQRRQNEIF